MTVKEFLCNIRKDQQKVNSLFEKIEKTRSKMSLHGINYKEKVQTSLETDQLADSVSQIEDYENEIRKETATLAIQREKALLIIRHLPDRKERFFLKKYYLSEECPTIEQLTDRDSYFTFYDWQKTIEAAIDHLETIRRLQSEPQEQTIPALLDAALDT